MSSLLLTQRAKIRIKLKSKKRYTEKIPKHTKIASFLLLLTPALSSSYLAFIFIIPSLYLHCVFVHSSPVRIAHTVLPPLQSAIFRHYIPPLLGRSLRIGEYVNGVRILFLSPRNPVFTIFNPVVLYYYSITYTPFLYQSSKIRISFL